jgi:hypothetical protein
VHHLSERRPSFAAAGAIGFIGNELGLTGPPWWADREARAARREARRRKRFIDC